MKKLGNLVYAGERAIGTLECRPATDGPYMNHLYGKLCDQAGRRLRRAVTAALNEVDLDVLNEFRRVLKKLQRREKDSNRELTRLKLALEIFKATLNKKQPSSGDHAAWEFTEIYKRLDYVMKQEELRNGR